MRTQRTEVIVQCKLIRDNPEEVGIDCLVLAFCGTALNNETDEECLLTAGLTLNFLQSSEQARPIRKCHTSRPIIFAHLGGSKELVNAMFETDIR